MRNPQRKTEERQRSRHAEVRRSGVSRILSLGNYGGLHKTPALYTWRF